MEDERKMEGGRFERDNYCIHMVQIPAGHTQLSTHATHDPPPPLPSAGLARSLSRYHPPPSLSLKPLASQRLETRGSTSLHSLHARKLVGKVCALGFCYIHIYVRDSEFTLAT